MNKESTADKFSNSERLLGWLVTPLYVPLFFGILLIFHPLIVLSHRLLGSQAFQRMLELMNICLITNFRLAGTRIHILGREHLPKHRAIIFVMNHQSMYDIPLLVWYLRSVHPKFIAKKKLGKGLPSISYALRHMGSVLIDRKDRKASIQQIKAFGEACQKNRWAACIFPEGTRAREGVLKRYKSPGIESLLRSMPDAVVIPAVIENSWKLVWANLFPIPFGVTVRLHIFPELERAGKSGKEIAELCEQQARSVLGQLESERVEFDAGSNEESRYM